MEHLPFEKRLEQVGFTQPGERMSVGKPVCHLAAGEASLHIWGGQQEYAAELFIAVSSTRTRGKRQKLRREVQTLFPHKKKLFPHKKKTVRPSDRLRREPAQAPSLEVFKT